jgi:catechol 2,3-dioxygenase-like lactoylglutathione lyase family enzyme
MTSTHESTVISPAKLGYVIMYVPDVEKTIAWYSKAFGLSVRRIDNGQRWAEMETGSTTLAFTPLEQHETAITGGKWSLLSTCTADQSSLAKLTCSCF